MDIVGSEIKTVIEEGIFEEPVEPRLPFRAVTRAQLMPICEGWFIAGETSVCDSEPHKVL